MIRIHQTTFIKAPIERVFDLSRSISLHKISMQETKENAINGITSGLLQKDDSVTWESFHLGKKRIMVIKITEMESPLHFSEEQIDGDFKSFKHQHFFKTVDNGTIMIDYIDYQTPFGIIGFILEKLLLENYIKNLLQHKNEFIKKYAETDLWKALIA
jgi:ligand-binding SRPBCC domain-containing protein